MLRKRDWRLSGIVIVFCPFAEKIFWCGGGWILGFFALLFEGVGKKWLDVDGFFVVKLWCFGGEVVVFWW
jgi:hypothetical protein